MSSVITSVLNLTVGLLWNKFRDYTANKLRNGDLTDDKCRQLIVRELDDIKTKIDASARKDLLSSICFLKEALGVLSLSQDESADGETSSAQEHKEDIGQAEGATMLVAGCSSLSQAISRLNIASKDRFTSAKISFEKSNTEATRAFCNDALSVEDRIMATKLRVMSRILASLEDPDAAVVACKGYLKELHDLPAVREMFSVQLSGGMKYRFNKTKRLENVMSVTMINFVVFDFAMKFSKIRGNLFNWPKIKLRKRKHNPMFLKSDMLKKMEESGVRSPSQFTLMLEKESVHTLIYHAQVNSKGEIIGMVDITIRNVCRERGNVYKFTAGEGHLFCTLPQEDTEGFGFSICSLAIDEEDNLYIVARCRNHSDKVYNYKLFVFDAKGNMKQQSLLEFLHGDNSYYRSIAVTTDMIVIYEEAAEVVYVCDSSGQMKYSFSLEEKCEYVSLSISDKKEIIVAPGPLGNVFIYTEEGKLMKRFEVHEGHRVLRVAFNHVTKEIILLTRSIVYLLSYKSGELRGTIRLPSQYQMSFVINITSHPCGSVALICDERVLYIQ